MSGVMNVWCNAHQRLLRIEIALVKEMGLTSYLMHTSLLGSDYKEHITYVIKKIKAIT